MTVSLLVRYYKCTRTHLSRQPPLHDAPVGVQNEHVYGAPESFQLGVDWDHAETNWKTKNRKMGIWCVIKLYSIINK